MTPCAEVPIKVNCWVDEGIAPLVEALNEFDGVRTLMSSAEGQGEFGRGAYVTFCYTGEEDAARFVADLTRRLRAAPDPLARLQIEWRPAEGDFEPLLIVCCSPHRVHELARFLLAPAAMAA